METYWYYVFSFMENEIEKTGSAIIKTPWNLFPLKDATEQMELNCPKTSAKVIINQTQITKKDYDWLQNK